MGLDMLEFIQSSENGRLSERVTKFIMYQVRYSIIFVRELNFLFPLAFYFLIDICCIRILTQKRYCSLRLEAGEYLIGYEGASTTSAIYFLI